MPLLPWLQRFGLWQSVFEAAKQSGVTADRPTSGLYVGRFYFDTTLNKPIWLKTVSPVEWIDATGAIV